jgi:hypothetical protein
MKSGTYKKGSVEGDDEISLEEFAASYSVKNDDIGAALTKSGTGGSKGLEATDRKFNSAMGNFLGKGSELKERKIVADVKERKGDGSALKALVARRVSSKVNAERKRIQSCVDRHSDSYTGSGGQLRASLHFGENGKVHQVTIKGGSKQLEKCFHEIFVGWRISMIHRKIKIPIAVRFE